MKKSYIALDVEVAGNRLGYHTTLSIGACLITHDLPKFETARERGMIFYTELKPQSLSYVTEAMKVGCLYLKCLDEIREQDSRYNPLSEDFQPKLVLQLMQDRCEEPIVATDRFQQWIKSIAGSNKIEGVTDTIFFDGGRVDLCFGVNSTSMSPFGWTGLDLDSLYRGYTGIENSKLSELDLPDNRIKPHKADHDAHFLAQLAQELFFNKMGWKAP